MHSVFFFNMLFRIVLYCSFFITVFFYFGFNVISQRISVRFMGTTFTRICCCVVHFSFLAASRIFLVARSYNFSPTETSCASVNGTSTDDNMSLPLLSSSFNGAIFSLLFGNIRDQVNTSYKLGSYCYGLRYSFSKNYLFNRRSPHPKKSSTLEECFHGPLYDKSTNKTINLFGLLGKI